MRGCRLRSQVLCCVGLTCLAAFGADESADEDAGASSDAAAAEPAAQAQRIESMTVVAAKPRTFATNRVADPMLAQQSPVSSIMAAVDNLPGVSVQEGDPYGNDPWSSGFSMRGFHTHLTEAQIGTTIDGFPNGTSDYWSGSKANRFIDMGNLGEVTVSQGTADIGSRSVEALGGTLDFTSDDPASARRTTAAATFGDHAARRLYLRLDTGPLFGTDTLAWISVAHQRSRDWVQGTVETTRDHAAAKVQTWIGNTQWTAMVSYDDLFNAAYQRLLSDAEYRANPRWDRLLDEWTGIPYVDQLYRYGWSTPRTDGFGYVKFETTVSELTAFSGGVYAHSQWGRGDWVPPFVVDLIDDAGGSETELTGQRVSGGESIGRLFFVSPAGVALVPIAGCASSIDFPYGGAGPEYDPACHPPDAIPVQSFRHSHYGKLRTGLVLDGEWGAEVAGMRNRLRAGLWVEDGRRDLGRDWHRILDTREGVDYEAAPYWHQYEWEFPQSIAKLHLEDTLTRGAVEVSFGVSKHFVEVGRKDAFGEAESLTVSSDSDLLVSTGVIYDTPLAGLQLFAGRSQNFKSLSDRLFEVPGRDLSQLSPETADNTDLGARYTGERLALTATWYDIDFRNRIFFVTPQTPTGPNYLVAGGGSYFNAGGIRSRGIEISATFEVTASTSLYAALTRNDASYIGTGDALVAEAQGITPGNRVAGGPDQQAVLSLDHRQGDWVAGISAKYTGERPVLLDGSWTADPYWLTDAYIDYTMARPMAAIETLQLALVVNNLFDEPYLSSIAGPGSFLGAPRTASITATATF